MFFHSFGFLYKMKQMNKPRFERFGIAKRHVPILLQTITQIALYNEAKWSDEELLANSRKDVVCCRRNSMSQTVIIPPKSREHFIQISSRFCHDQMELEN